jgi:hypothetical protein
VGQQQLLLLLVGVIICGLMVMTGFYMFTDSASAANRDALAGDLMMLASQAQQYYFKPAVFGGGNNSMAGYDLPPRRKNANGSFTLASVTGSSVEIEAVGTEIGYDASRPVKVTIRVYRDSVQVTEIN